LSLNSYNRAQIDNYTKIQVRPITLFAIVASYQQGAAPLKLTTIQTDVLNNNINLVTELAETLYQESLHNGKGKIRLNKRQQQLERLATGLDDIRGALFAGH
jgi:hypothetical protein